ncbi:hypothetical protein F6R98_09310 [Candidatus Methylospira mobilis]|uniref:Cytochrome C oxidase subunit I n=1 Tax=Candidatus Methylospira mobilis TaxID=1808979 RepID=A0A5Q0BI46_9GAMM|nr:hypothetical protein [Candidatus Methylospira mobilis]QFY42792.1 hypothetical protein F6R98_09310 [Candidatus Methylospira mobilis]WNV03684.1 hypothetical protein RP726_14705 [Candidatus Methylospira mobilis]
MINNDISSAQKSKSNMLLLAFAGFCLAIALIIAWVLGVTLFFPQGVLAGYIYERADIIRAHVDYLMMSQFLFIFFLLFRQFAVNPPLWVVGACCFGAFFNPLAFLKRGLAPKPDLATAIPVEPHFPLMAGISFTLITVGFITATALVVVAAWKSRSLPALELK